MLSKEAWVTTYFNDSDWLWKNFDQLEKGRKCYHGKQNWGYHLKEVAKSVSEIGDKSNAAFSLGPPVEKRNGESRLK